ncbi:MAG: P1 family peptidase [Acidimicrobiales bacterium]|nr:P1 family peptidase [Acidimicrobiales bacterium]MDG1845060.1 P1 family peptidase [Acidimicrobiales bacterium]
MITGIDGITVGNWTDENAATGCTVVIFPEGTIASGEIRGGAPASRDFALLHPDRMINRIDSVVLSGGSAFGLSACTGVMEFLEERGQGFPTAAGPVPIVVGMSLFDLNEGEPKKRPGAEEGKEAARSASSEKTDLGLVGAGTGATISKWKGRENAQPGGLGGAICRSGDLIVATLFAVNASGDIDDGSSSQSIADETFKFPEVLPFENTTIGVVVTNARLSKGECFLVSQSAHDGFAKALFPSHTEGDGDAAVVAATGQVDANLGTVRLLTTVAVEKAIRSVGIQP